MSALEYAREKFAGVATVDVVSFEGDDFIYARRDKNPVAGKESIVLPLSPETEAKWANEAAIDDMYAKFIEIYPEE